MSEIQEIDVTAISVGSTKSKKNYLMFKTGDTKSFVISQDELVVNYPSLKEGACVGSQLPKQVKRLY